MNRGITQRMAVAAWLALAAAAATPSQAAVEVFWSAPDLKVETGLTIAQAAGNQDAAFSPARSLTSSAFPANLQLNVPAHDEHRADDGSIDATADSASSASLSALLAAENSGITAVGITGVNVALSAGGSGAAAAEGIGSGNAELHVTFEPLVDLPVTLIAGVSCFGADGTCATEVVLYDLTIGGNTPLFRIAQNAPGEVTETWVGQVQRLHVYALAGYSQSVLQTRFAGEYLNNGAFSVGLAFSDINVIPGIPEPGSAWLCAAGCVAIGWRARRMRAARG